MVIAQVGELLAERFILHSESARRASHHVDFRSRTVRNVIEADTLRFGAIWLVSCLVERLVFLLSGQFMQFIFVTVSNVLTILDFRLHFADLLLVQSDLLLDDLVGLADGGLDHFASLLLFAQLEDLAQVLQNVPFFELLEDQRFLLVFVFNRTFDDFVLHST